MSNKIKLGIFVPSTFDNYQFLEGLLNKKLDEIGLIISNNSGHKLPERYGHEKGIATLSYPIGKHLNVLAANEKIIKASDRILILENGQSTNNETVKKKCFAANRDYKVINVPEDITSRAVMEELKGVYGEFINRKNKEQGFVEFLVEHKRLAAKLEKEMGKIK